MGRQIALIASPADEQALLAYLRECGPIQLCVRAAKTAADLWLDDFPPFDPLGPRCQYFIWNQAFDWSPKLIQQTAEGGGLIDEIWAGPVIEFTRTVILDQPTVDNGICRGRIYWAQENTHDGFVAWYQRVAGWVRHNGENLSTRGVACYYLPDALRIWQDRQPSHAEPGAATDRGGSKDSRDSRSPRRRGR